MSDGVFALLVLLGCPVLVAALFWVLARLEGDTDDPGSTPFDPPPWWS